MAELNPRAGVIEVQPMTTFIGRAQAQTKFALVLIAIFAAIALVLAAVGLYSVLSTVGAAADTRRSACAWRSAPSTGASSA